MAQTRETKEGPLKALTSVQKEFIFDQLKGIPDKNLLAALTEAALTGLNFPKPISEELGDLQKVHLKHSVDSSMFPHSKALIEIFLEKNFSHFKKLFIFKFEEEQWQSAFLLFLKNKLNIQLAETALVKIQLKDGKLYWRYMLGEKIIRQCKTLKENKFEFDEKQSLTMPWNLFQTIKNSGKRFSTVAITKERFANAGGREEVRQELKAFGILNAQDRLSHSWRAISNNVIKLKKVLPTDIQRIYTITNNPAYAEKMPDPNDIPHYRHERSIKILKKTKRVNHDSSNSQAVSLVGNTLSMQSWDVTTYGEAGAIRNGMQTSLGDTITYDHIPSTGAIKIKGRNLLAELKEKYTNKQQELLNLENKLLEPGPLKKPSRFKIVNRLDPSDAIKQNIETIKNDLVQIDKEYKDVEATLEKEKLYFTIAIPNELHKQGVTYMASLKKQKEDKKPEFYKEIEFYLNTLEKRGNEFFSKPDEEYLKAWGAFRFMYRMNTKPIPNIPGTKKIGWIQQTLFAPDIRNQIDALFTEKMQGYLRRREGL